MLSVFPSTLPPQAPLSSILFLCWVETTSSGNTFPFKGRLLQAACTLWEDATSLCNWVAGRGSRDGGLEEHKGWRALSVCPPACLWDPDFSWLPK